MMNNVNENDISAVIDSQVNENQNSFRNDNDRSCIKQYC